MILCWSSGISPLGTGCFRHVRGAEKWQMVNRSRHHHLSSRIRFEHINCLQAYGAWCDCVEGGWTSVCIRLLFLWFGHSMSHTEWANLSSFKIAAQRQAKNVAVMLEQEESQDGSFVSRLYSLELLQYIHELMNNKVRDLEMHRKWDPVLRNWHNQLNWQTFSGLSYKLTDPWRWGIVVVCFRSCDGKLSHNVAPRSISATSVRNQQISTGWSASNYKCFISSCTTPLPSGKVGEISKILINGSDGKHARHDREIQSPVMAITAKAFNSFGFPTLRSIVKILTLTEEYLQVESIGSR